MFAKRETHSAHIGNGKIRNPKTNTSKGQPSRMMVHAKLEMTEPSDNEEREADLMADAIVSGGKISRAVEGNASQGGVAVPKGMENQLNQCQGGGRAMPDGLRSMMETGFGQDFSTVRLHTDNQAAEMSSAIHARAFTYGNNIFFNQGQYSPDTPAGQRLIAHELTHVVQGEGKVARKVNEEISENIYLIDEEQVAWSKSLSNGLSGFKADNLAMLNLIAALYPKILKIINLKESILKISESAIMPSDLNLPDVSLKDIKDIEEQRALIFNSVKIAIENSKKGKANAKNALNDAISEFQAMGEALVILSDNYEEIITNLNQLKANLEEELKKAATKLYFEIIDRRNLIKVKFQKVQYGWELLRETKDNAYWYVRWTAAPSDSKLDNIKSSINNVANGANAIESFYTRYKDKIDESKGSGLIIQFESFKELSEWAKFFNDKANEVGPKLYEIDCKISDLRNDHISSAENWATGLKITSEIAITVSSCFIPGGAAAKLAVWGSKAYKASKLVNSIANLKKFKIPERIATVPKVIEKLSHTFTNKTLHFINKNNITKVSASLVKEASLNITGTGIETLSKLSSNVTSNWLFEEDVYKLPEGKDWLKSGLSGAVLGTGMGIFRYFKISKLAKKGVSEGAENVTNNFNIIDIFSGEGLANGGFAFLGDKIAEGVVDRKVTSPSWTDLTYLVGVFNIRKPQFRTRIISKELDQAEVDLYKRNKLDAIDKKITKREKLNTEKTELETEKTGLETDKTGLKNDKTVLENEKTVLENEKTVLEKAKLENEQKELVTKKTELETEKTGLETDKTGLETEKTELKKKKTELENDKTFETKKTELENEKTKLVGLKNEKTKLNAFNICYTNMTNLKNIVNSLYKRINPTNEFKGLDNFIKTLDNKKNELNDKIRELEANIKQKGDDIRELNAIIKQKGDDIRELEANIKQKGVDIREFEANITKKGNEIGKLEAKITKKGNEIGKLDAKITKKEADIGELEAKIEQKGVDISELEANIKQKGVDIRELEANIKQKGVDIRELEANITKKGNEIDKLEAKITKKGNEIDKLEAKIKETRGSDKSIDDIKSEINEELDKLILENLYKSKYEKKYNIDNYGITSKKLKWKLFPDKDYDMENYKHFDIQEGLISKSFYKNKDRIWDLNVLLFSLLFSSEEKAEEKKEEYIPIQKQFFTKEKYREDGKMKRYYVFFTSGSTEINKQEDIDKIAISIQERKMNKNAIINIRIIGLGKKLNEELANKRADIVKETLFNKLLERHITHNEINSTINIETMVSIADYDTANEIENNANPAILRSVIIEINTQ